MKKLIIPFIALVIASVTFISFKTVAPATVINDFGCTLYDGDGGFAFADASHAVINSNGDFIKCKATVVNSQGKAVRYDDFLCGTLTGVTSDSHETVSASGQATLTCRIKN